MKRIPLFTSQLTDKDISEGERVLRRNYQLTKGEEVIEFERALAKYLDRKYCLVVNSGCSAITMASITRCLVQKFTYEGVREAIWYGSRSIPEEIEIVEDETYGIEPEALRRHLQIGSVFVTHIAGFPSKYTMNIRNICDEHRITMIEDACQGFGGRIGNVMVGSIGDISVLSFCQNKLITTGGEGGALLTDNRNIWFRAKNMREYNMRMSSHQAAIGLSQLSRIDEIIEERRRQAHILNKVYPCALKEIDGHYQTYQMYLVKPEVEVPDYVETKMRFNGCELLKEIPLSLSQEVAEASEVKSSTS